jgi:hypothetical protein
MRILKLDSSCYLIEGKHAEGLEVGFLFKGETIVGLKIREFAGESYVEVCVDRPEYKI